jgi:hypothetical protein
VSKKEPSSPRGAWRVRPHVKSIGADLIIKRKFKSVRVGKDKCQEAPLTV